MPLSKVTTSRFVRATIFIVAGAVLIYHVWHSREVNTITLILLAITLSPMLSILFENISIGDAKLQFRVEKNEEDIDNLKFMMRHFITMDELSVLFRLSRDIRVRVNPSNWTYQYDKARLLRLRELGFVYTPDGKGFGAMERAGVEQDARDHFRVTDRGREFLTRRENAVGRIDLPDLPNG